MGAAAQPVSGALDFMSSSAFEGIDASSNTILGRLSNRPRAMQAAAACLAPSVATASCCHSCAQTAATAWYASTLDCPHHSRLHSPCDHTAHLISQVFLASPY